MPVMEPDGQSVESAQIQQRTTELNQQAAAMQASAQSLKAAAGSGFHLEPEAAATLIKACQDSLHELNTLQRDVEQIRQAPKLGQTPGATLIAPFTQNVAMDPQGMIPALTNLQHTLEAMEQAYRQASTNYQETEAIIAASLKHQQTTLPSTPSPRPQGHNRAV
jgi:DNA repair exonuclease SbcCD ATPase subunit